MMKTVLGFGAALLLCGCVAETPLSVSPGQGKSYADLQRDDAACRGAPVAAAGTTTTQAATATAAPDYYQCMAAHGELVTGGTPAVYPAYAAYAVPYAYGYPYPYGVGYPGYGYGYPYLGYPYSAAYYGPFVGVGLGFGGYYHGGYYGRGFYHGGFYRGGYGGFHGGYGGFHGGGFHR